MNLLRQQIKSANLPTSQPDAAAMRNGEYRPGAPSIRSIAMPDKKTLGVDVGKAPEARARMKPTRRKVIVTLRDAPFFWSIEGRKW
jgi:hypothetical protein